MNKSLNFFCWRPWRLGGSYKNHNVHVLSGIAVLVSVINYHC